MRDGQQILAPFCGCAFENWRAGTADARLGGFIGLMAGVLVSLVTAGGLGAAVWVTTQNGGAALATAALTVVVNVAVLVAAERAVREIRARSVPIEGESADEAMSLRNQRRALYLVIALRGAAVTSLTTIGTAGLISVVFASEIQAQNEIVVEERNGSIKRTVDARLATQPVVSEAALADAGQDEDEARRRFEDMRVEYEKAKASNAAWKALSDCEYAGMNERACNVVVPVALEGVSLTGQGGPGPAHVRFETLAVAAGVEAERLRSEVETLDLNRRTATAARAEALSVHDAALAERAAFREKALLDAGFVADAGSIPVTWLESLWLLDERAETYPRIGQLVICILIAIGALELGLLISLVARSFDADSIDVAARVRETVQAEKVAAELFADSAESSDTKSATDEDAPTPPSY